MTFHDLLFNKLWLKVFSLVLAVLIWSVIQTNFSSTEVRLPQNPLRLATVRDFLEPVVVMTAAASRQIYQITPAEVRVTVRGAASIVDQLSADDIQVFVRLVDVADARGIFRLETKVPPEINPQDVQVSPPNVHVRTVSLPLTGQP
jgi:tRNA A37 threonylcarbamoyladenosine synthetase subunit TsaC/SUA5/YrdC